VALRPLPAAIGAFLTVFTLQSASGAQAQSYTLTAPVLQGQSADPVAGAVFVFFDWSPAINNAGLLAFSADLDGGKVAVFSLVDDTLSLLALKNRSAAGTGGLDFCSFDLPPTVNDSDEVAFPSRISEGCTGFGTEGIFLAAPTATALVTTGDPAPVAGGPGFCTFTRAHVNASAQVAFSATYDGGSGCFGAKASGLFIDSSLGTVAAIVEGDSAPGAGGGRFWSFPEPPSINDSGDLAFVADVDTSSNSTPNVARGVFYKPADDAPEKVARPGDLTEDSVAFSLFLDGAVGLNEAGDVAFNAELAGGIPGVFVKREGSPASALALRGDSVPGTGDHAFESFPHPPAINAAGDSAFFATIRDPQDSIHTGIFVHSDGALWAVALEGANLAEGTLTEVREVPPSLNDAGDITFVAQLDTGAAAPVAALVVALLPEPLAAFQQLTVLVALALFQRRNRCRDSTHRNAPSAA